MKTIIAHWGLGSRHGEEENSHALAVWEREHEGYYSLPHGARESHPEVCGVRFDRYCGLQSRIEAAEMWIHLVMQHDEILRISDVLRAVENPRIPIGGWLTSAGNLTLVLGCYEYRSGRRHGIRMAQRTDDRDGYTYLETKCGKAKPDEMDLEPEAEAVAS